MEWMHYSSSQERRTEKKQVRKPATVRKKTAADKD